MTGKKKAAKAGDNSARSLDAVERAWDKLDRDDVFARGALLREVRELVEPRQWLAWLKDRGWHDETARRAMDASRLAAKFPILRDLPLPKLVVYGLACWVKDGEPLPELPDIIEALDVATKNATERLQVKDFGKVIQRARQRFAYGDAPAATCDGLDTIADEEAEWAKAASDELKKQWPESEEEAGKIVFELHHAHVAELYAEHGILPKMVDGGWDGHKVLTELEDEIQTPPEYRARMLERLLAEPQPLTALRVDEMLQYGECRDATPSRTPSPEPDDKQDDDKQGAEQGAKQPEPNKSKPTGKRGDGADVGAEVKKLKKIIDDLTKKVEDAFKVIDGRNRQIELLNHEIRKLEADPKGPIEKHVEALVTALKKVSREKTEVTVEDLCAKLRIDPRKLNPPDGKAAA